MKLKQLFIIASVVTMPAYAQQKWDLKQCIDHAIANNLTIKLQEAQREQSKVELSTAKNSFLPDLNGSASHSFNSAGVFRQTIPIRASTPKIRD